MARADVPGAMSRLALALATASFVASCGRGGEQPDSSNRFSGTVDNRHFVHPKVSGPDRLLVKGCCTFKVDAADVEQLPGDVDGRLVRGQGYRLEIAFGNRLAPLPPAFARSGERIVDGVKLTEFRASPKQFALQATVPLSEDARERKIDFPDLQAVGRCETSEGCARVENVLGSIRF